MGKITLHEFIRKYKISQSYLAGKMRMNLSTFKQKLNKKFPLSFSPDEEKRLLFYVREFATDVLNFACNYSLNKEQKNEQQ